MSSVLPAVNSSTTILSRATVPGDLATTTASESQDRFLKLLVTQMRNQDPMNPMDNAQVTSQLAQISTVSGIDKLNTSLNGMAASMATASGLQNASLIGRDVLIEGDLARFDGTSPVPVGIALASRADKVGVAIVDAAGSPVRRFAFGELPSGISTFQWDGRNDAGSQVKAGDYAMVVEAAFGGQSVAASSLLGGKVESVSVQGAGSMLNLHKLGAVAVDQVRRVD